ncbi:hypothetical protein [Sulfurovum lithotrophicum]|uniref:hypothetical protein n=1 Tax=Sulfurovum lithotrophicum TaxID=206403 RepID=UPI000A010DDE|nr:hypothetical protein [Sulfurovum lithotrophicum]
MKSAILKLLLLSALFFNIAHAVVIASEEHCVHESAKEYVQEVDHGTKCGDLCDFHHFFHMSAIITPVIQHMPTIQHAEQPDTKLLTYHPPFKETENKPPIA